MHPSGCRRSPGAMLLIAVIAASTFRPARAAALPYNAYERADSPAAEKPEIFLLFDQRLPGFENELYASGGNEPVVRTKRISLSIVNPLEVLRDRVRLELARRQALQDQRQIEANRRLLETIGKRSAPDFPKISRLADRDGRLGRVRIPARSQDWYNGVESDAFRDVSDDQTRRVQTNEVNLL